MSINTSGRVSNQSENGIGTKRKRFVFGCCNKWIMSILNSRQYWQYWL